MPSPGKEDRFRHDSASHGKCDSPPGIPLRPRQHGAGPAPCPSAATPFAGGSCPCPPGTHRYRASISGSIWGYYMPVSASCQQESENFGVFPAKRGGERGDAIALCLEKARKRPAGRRAFWGNGAGAGRLYALRLLRTMTASLAAKAARSRNSPRGTGSPVAQEGDRDHGGQADRPGGIVQQGKVP